MAFAAWDTAQWDRDQWEATKPGPPGWDGDWTWWYQAGYQSTVAPTPVIDLDHMLVEARWTTESHTMGDGSFRGDLQPGKITAQLYDPDRVLDKLDKYGCMVAWYKPTNQVWLWFYESFTRGLYPPDDPGAADCVFTGSTWASRLTATRGDTNYNSQSVSSRLGAILATMQNAGIRLPQITNGVAQQNQTVATVTPGGGGSAYQYPSLLQSVRDAAANGVAWLSARTGTIGSSGTIGLLTLNYARWETSRVRPLDRSQVIAGPPVTAGIDYIISQAGFTATAGANGTQTNVYQYVGAATWGAQGPSQMKLWGNVDPNAPGPENAAATQTAFNICNLHQDPLEPVLSSISLQSGTRFDKNGKPAKSDWDPGAHVFGPTEVLQMYDDLNFSRTYRVTNSQHRLTALVWQTTHTLEKWISPAALPL